jgi:hypothetical protein
MDNRFLNFNQRAHGGRKLACAELFGKRQNAHVWLT